MNADSHLGRCHCARCILKIDVLYRDGIENRGNGTLTLPSMGKSDQGLTLFDSSQLRLVFQSSSFIRKTISLGDSNVPIKNDVVLDSFSTNYVFLYCPLSMVSFNYITLKTTI